MAEFRAPLGVQLKVLEAFYHPRLGVVLIARVQWWLRGGFCAPVLTYYVQPDAHDPDYHALVGDHLRKQTDGDQPPHFAHN